jgi:hypothetical protein
MGAMALVALAAVGALVWRAADTRARRWYWWGAFAWLAYTGALGASGVLARFDLVPPRMLLIVVPTFVLPIALAVSRLGTLVAGSTPIALLVLLHGFRLPLELTMHQAAVEGVMPPQMTYTGSNFDIVSGATAILVGALAWLDRAPRALLLAWNALGSLLLAIVVGIALASMPPWAAFGNEPERLNAWVAYFPYVWLPAGPVAVALFGHLLLWRRLLASGMRGRASSTAS